MPTYSYRCTECGTAFDIQQAFTDDSLTVCPQIIDGAPCGGKLRKLFHAVGVSFSGSGFYRNDSRAGETKAREKKEKAGADAAGGSSGSGGTGGTGGAGESGGTGGSAAKETAASGSSAPASTPAPASSKPSKSPVSKPATAKKE
ncbi:MAG: FmdB family zinc ribbon protein [Pseudolysinimonas sp.]